MWFTEALAIDSARGVSEEEHRIRIASVRRQLPRLQSVWHVEERINGLRFAGLPHSLLAIGDQVYKYDPSGRRSLEVLSESDQFIIKAELDDDASSLLAISESHDHSRNLWRYEFSAWDLETREKRVLFLQESTDRGRTLHDFSSDGKYILAQTNDTLKVITLSDQ